MKLAERVTRIVDFFYVKPLHKVISRQTFRYIICGGANMVFGQVLYFLIFHYVIMEQGADLGFLTITAENLAQIILIPPYILVGFWLQSNITFPDSPLTQKRRFGRYLIQNAGALVVDTLMINLFVRLLGIYPTVAKPMADLVTVLYSYLTARFFTFRGATSKERGKNR